MAYRFKIDEAPQKALRRIGGQQIDMALRRLTRKQDRAKEIHDARRAFKRIRALLRLVRPGLSKSDYQSENAHFRDIGRLLSPARDLQVLHDTVRLLEARRDGEAKATLTPVRRHVEQARTKSLDVFDAATADEAVARLEAARDRWRHLKVAPNNFQLVADGLEIAYGRAVSAMHKARAEEDDDALHDWRKEVQRHREHMQLLRLAWPAYCDARYESAKLLSRWLGDDHDLALLKSLPAKDDGPKMTRAGRAKLERLCLERQRVLRKASWALGERLFAEGPNGFARRMTLYWSTAGTIADEDSRDQNAE